MNDTTMEQIIMELVVNSGAARSLAMGALDDASEGNFADAEQKLTEAKEQINKAHAFQTHLIAKEADGEHQEMNLILVHGQDHLMTAMVVIDLAEQMVKMYKR